MQECLVHAASESLCRGEAVRGPRERGHESAELVAQLDTLSASHEARIGANPPWTRDKMNPALFSKMTGAIIGFEMRITAWRPTIKLSQNKSHDERERVINGVEATGHGALAQLMRHIGGDREGA